MNLFLQIEPLVDPKAWGGLGPGQSIAVIIFLVMFYFYRIDRKNSSDRFNLYNDRQVLLVSEFRTIIENNTKAMEKNSGAVERNANAIDRLESTVGRMMGDK